MPDYPTVEQSGMFPNLGRLAFSHSSVMVSGEWQQYGSLEGSPDLHSPASQQTHAGFF
jgi:hypothetical protein